MPRLLGRLVMPAYFVLMALLVASIAAPGIAAIGAFRTLPSLGIQLPAFAAYAESDPVVMGRLAAGMTMNPIFSVSMWITAALATLGLGAWILAQASGAANFRKASTRLANVAIVLLCSLAAASLIRSGDLERSLDQYHQRAREGERAGADAERVRFDGHHRVAERLNQGQLILAIAAIGLAAWSVQPRRDAVA